MKQNGYFGMAAGEYTLNKIPEAGLYEYIYKNDEILVKVDQYGVQTCQIDPPVGIALVKREKRELGSPIKFYFSCGKKVFDAFDIFKAKKFEVNFKPQKATYTLNFGEIETVAELLVPQSGRKLIVKLTVKNISDEEKKIKTMPCVYPYVNELMMAPRDKPEWYTRTQYKSGEISVFTTNRYSVQGQKEDRRYFSMLTDLPLSSAELSEERLTYATKNFSRIPDTFGGKTENEVYAGTNKGENEMGTAYERRRKVIKILNARRFEKIDNLAFELSVTRRTIEKDISFLAMEYPIYTIQGRNGGVEIMRGSSLTAIGLNREETALLQKLLISSAEEDSVILSGMIKKYGGG